ncbi:hypothetical protein AB4Z55_03105 [Gordonia sp. ABKF26]|uniref:hypothetical protein n=1 Tax=Gordonia sp. ABKF26 TaxID=3238687 RepID=UPI0034E59EBD
MYIVVEPSEKPTVREADDLKHLSIAASSRLQVPDVVESLRSIGLDPELSTQDHLRLDSRRLRDITSRALGDGHSRDWYREFDAMLSYAAGKGWYRPDTGMVDVHVDWYDAPAVQPGNRTSARE